MNAPTRDKSIPYGDDDAVLRAYREDGYVVVTDVLTRDEVQASVEELWTSPRLLGRPGLDRNDPETWTNENNWPQSEGGRNFLASSNLFLDATPWDLASNDRLLHLQQLLYGRQDLCVAQLSRWGVMRPGGRRPAWQTETSWLHWDQNPWTDPGFCRVQALVCLTDSTETTGGFVCVPGFHNRFEQWGLDHPEGTLEVGGRVLDKTFGFGQPFPIPQDDPCQSETVRVLAPAGAMILWDSRLPHQNFPNTDLNDLRVVYYTNMIVRDEKTAQAHRSLLERKWEVMKALGQRGLRFPHSLSLTGKRVNCLPEDFGVEDSAPVERNSSVARLHEAIRLVAEAGEAEEDGDTATAISLHRQSMRIYPDIEDWHDAVFQ